MRKSKKITLTKTQEALNEIKKWPNLRDFQNHIESFSSKYGISRGQVNFLIAVVAVERIELNKVL